MFGNKKLEARIKWLEKEVKRIGGVQGYILRDELSIQLPDSRTGEEDLRDVKLRVIVQELMERLKLRPAIKREIEFQDIK